MTALTYNTTANTPVLRPARFDRALLTLADLLRAWAVRRMVHRHEFACASEPRRALQAQLRIGPWV